MDAPGIRSDATMAQEINNLRSTIDALDAEVRRLRARNIELERRSDLCDLYCQEVIRLREAAVRFARASGVMA